MKKLSLALFLTLLPVTALADWCTITCPNGTSCEAVGESVRCKCSWLTGNARCRSRGETLEEFDKKGVTFEPSEEDVSFAALGGDFEALLQSEIYSFYSQLITNFGFDQRTHSLIENFEAVRNAYIQAEDFQYKLALGALEDSLLQFHPKERNLLAKVALKAASE